MKRMQSWQCYFNLSRLKNIQAPRRFKALNLSLLGGFLINEQFYQVKMSQKRSDDNC